MTLETQVREAFEELTSEPPGFHTSVEDVLTAGRQARRRKRVRLTALGVPAVAGLSVVAVVGVTALAGSHHGAGGTTTVQFASAGTHHSAKASRAENPASDAVRAAVIAASPSGFSLDIPPIARPVESEFGIDGTANDGNGAGRVYVVVDPLVGSLTPAPCSDPDFVAGGSCTSTMLPDGNTLVLRGENGTKYTQVMAVVIHPDGTGTTAESDNGTFANVSARKSVVAKRDIGLEHVTRADPTYTVEQLGQVAVAADQAASQCLATHCNAS
jgi:hypothetical protein